LNCARVCISHILYTLSTHSYHTHVQYTTAQRSGFFLYLNVKLVPFFAFVLLGRQISIPTWVSALTALAGTSLLAYDGTSLALNTGDLWSIAAAAASAMFILRLESASAQVPNAAALNASCLWVVTLASLIWSASLGLVTVDNMVDTLTAHPLELLYLSAVTTALANWIQTKAQKNVTAERASVIYAMDPVWGAIWANLLLGETLSGYGIVGAGFITVAAATNAFLDLGAKESSEKV
jgi:drug/metabolite transporter (DMT)-like permease